MFRIELVSVGLGVVLTVGLLSTAIIGWHRSHNVRINNNLLTNFEPPNQTLQRDRHGTSPVRTTLLVPARPADRLGESVWVAGQLAALTCQVWFMSVCRAVLLWHPWAISLATSATRPLKTARSERIREFGLAIGLVTEQAFMVWWALSFYLGRWSG
jgi:hypothetical protein